MVPRRRTVLFIGIVVSLLTAVSISSDESWNVYYVKPAEAKQCPSDLQPCHTLQYYVNNSNFSSKSTFRFMKGLHTLQGTAEAKSMSNLVLVGMGGPEDSKIGCTGSAGFFFMQMNNLTISNLSLVPRPCAFVACSTKFAQSFVLQATNALRAWERG